MLPKLKVKANKQKATNTKNFGPNDPSNSKQTHSRSRSVERNKEQNLRRPSIPRETTRVAFEENDEIMDVEVSAEQDVEFPLEENPEENSKGQDGDENYLSQSEPKMDDANSNKFCGSRSIF